MAIKTTRTAEGQNEGYDRPGANGYASELFSYPDKLSSLMDEAKTMWRVGSYNENIVNLQGITATLEGGTITQVITFTCYIIIPSN